MIISSVLTPSSLLPEEHECWGRGDNGVMVAQPRLLNSLPSCLVSPSSFIIILPAVSFSFLGNRLPLSPLWLPKSIRYREGSDTAGSKSFYNHWGVPIKNKIKAL